MSANAQFYVSDLAILLCVNIIAVWGLDLQYGVVGINNFAFVVFQAIGGYVAALVTLGPEPRASAQVQQYIWGAHWPYPLPLLSGAVAAGAFGLLVAAVALRRLRADYQAVVMLVVSLIATGVAEAQIGLVNGPSGLVQIPQPLAGVLGLGLVQYQWVYLGITVACCAITLWVMQRISSAPLGRILRAVRENETAAAALGKNVTWLRVSMFVVGCMFAGLSGALFVQFLGAWSPASWLYPETFLFFTAVIVGGTGNLLGTAVGTLIVVIGFYEGTQYLPQIGYPGLTESLDWVAIGFLMLAFLWFRPRGLIPERRRRFAWATAAPYPRPGGLSAGESGRGTVVMTGAGEGRGTPRNGDAQVSESTRPLLEVRDVWLRFGGVAAVQGMSFVVAEGTVTGLIGPNGAGKSSVVNMIAGSTAPTSGSIFLEGRELTGEPAYRVARRGVIRTFQAASLFPRLTVLENLLVAVQGCRGEMLREAFLGRLYWMRAQAKAVEQARALLESFGLQSYEDAYAADLSGGQKRLVELMRALMAEPHLLLLDEPTAGLSPTAAYDLMERLVALAGNGLTMLIVEHELPFVERVCDCVLVMAQGSLICAGPMDEVRANQAVIDAYLS